MHKEKIFVLEDDPDIRQVVQLILELENYTIASFANFEEFMNRDPADVPDLFIIDLMLPDGSGIGFAKR